MKEIRGKVPWAVLFADALVLRNTMKKSLIEIEENLAAARTL